MPAAICGNIEHRIWNKTRIEELAFNAGYNFSEKSRSDKICWGGFTFELFLQR